MSATDAPAKIAAAATSTKSAGSVHRKSELPADMRRIVRLIVDDRVIRPVSGAAMPTVAPDMSSISIWFDPLQWATR
ncbi:MAG: hypothetical protein LT070_07720 [Solirubrobacteraceae bacterium]|nr:hypothetical protein [Solirubrobacteraceae bacterium]